MNKNAFFSKSSGSECGQGPLLLLKTLNYAGFFPPLIIYPNNTHSIGKELAYTDVII